MRVFQRFPWILWRFHWSQPSTEEAKFRKHKFVWEVERSYRLPLPSQSEEMKFDQGILVTQWWSIWGHPRPNTTRNNNREHVQQLKKGKAWCCFWGVMAKLWETANWSYTYDWFIIWKLFYRIWIYFIQRGLYFRWRCRRYLNVRKKHTRSYRDICTALPTVIMACQPITTYLLGTPNPNPIFFYR